MSVPDLFPEPAEFDQETMVHDYGNSPSYRKNLLNSRFRNLSKGPLLMLEDLLVLDLPLCFETAFKAAIQLAGVHTKVVLPSDPAVVEHPHTTFLAVQIPNSFESIARHFSFLSLAKVSAHFLMN